MNFSFQFVCSTQIKMYQESSFLGTYFVLCTAGSLELPRASSLALTKALSWTHWGVRALPDPLLLQAMTYGYCISCLRQDTIFIHALPYEFSMHLKCILSEHLNSIDFAFKVHLKWAFKTHLKCFF